MTNEYHTPVLLETVTQILQPKSGERYIDATFGGGGHTQALLEAGAQVLGLDQDQEAIDHAQNMLKQYEKLQLAKTNFSQLRPVALKTEFDQIDGILFDLGVSSWQLDQIDRGFSFQGDAPLDMRMDTSLPVRARDLVAVLSAKELTLLLKKYGDEAKAKAIASRIVKQRKQTPIETTAQLASLVESVYRYRQAKIHPATKTFQALRIAINDEHNALKAALPQAMSLLKPRGVLVVISFHSGEDRMIKQFLKKTLADGEWLEISRKPLTPSQSEINKNPRARSAKLRYAVRAST